MSFLGCFDKIKISEKERSFNHFFYYRKGRGFRNYDVNFGKGVYQMVTLKKRGRGRELKSDEK